MSPFWERHSPARFEVTQLAVADGRWERIDPPAWFDLVPDYGVLELDEALTVPGPALELHVAASDHLGLVAWWLTDSGATLGFVVVGVA